MPPDRAEHRRTCRRASIDYLKKWQLVDVANAENIQKNIDLLMKAPAPRPATTPAKGNSKAKVNSPVRQQQGTTKKINTGAPLSQAVAKR